MLFDEEKERRLSTPKGNNCVSFKVYNAWITKQTLEGQSKGQPEAQLSLVA